MPIIRLTHFRRLGYTSLTKKTAATLPDDVVAMADGGAVVVTFRPLDGRRPDRLVKRIHAAERFSWIKGQHVILFGLETDSPLAPLILWDVVHSATLDSTITVMGNGSDSSYLQRSYYQDGLELIEQQAGKSVFRKIAPLGAERDAGLDAWTFGIPVGPEDATLLNVTVKRILELNVPEKEILLCGRPGNNFLYFDKVRIVGEDITAPPVKICAKKNRLAEEALYPNLCIIHDRVFLPRDFDTAIQKFGDCYPLMTMQSVYCDDRYNMVARRYSDFGVSNRVRGQSTKGLMRDNDTKSPSEFSPNVLAITEMAGFYAGSAMRYSKNVYATGSMYLCKRSVWLKHPQNENLHWIEFEDLEHGFRASDAGVPSRINPYAFTQSLISRPLLARAVGSFIEDAKGNMRIFRPWTEFLPLPRKPAIKLAKETALASMNQFAQKYVPQAIWEEIPVASVHRSRKRLSALINVLSRVKVPMKADTLRGFLQDFEKMMVFDQMPFSWFEHTCHQLLSERARPVDALILKNDSLINHMALRPKGGIFYESLAEYLQPRSTLLYVGSLFSAIYLFWKRKHVLYLKGGLLAYYRALINTTPFIDYDK